MTEETDLFVVRMWDAEAKRWTTLTEPDTEAETTERWNAFTADGTAMTGENEETYYYEVFPAKPKETAEPLEES
jgi:hypothetical protein